MKQIALGSLAALLLAGCSQLPTTAKAPLPDRVEEMTQWQTEGRVGIRTEQDAVSGNFHWQHTNSHYELNIYGPFGQGSTRLEGQPGGSATLTYDDKALSGPDAETLLYRELGWHFPVTQVQYWIRGLPSPASEAKVEYTMDAVTPAQILQDGWTVTYKEYTTQSHLKLPQKIQVARPPYRVNLIITTWKLL